MLHQRVIRLVTVGVALAAAGWLSGCSRSSPPNAPGGGNTTGPAPFNLGPFALGQSTRLVFPNVGAFGYHCLRHQGNGMSGTVTVSSSAVEDSAVVAIGTGNALTFTPSSVTIKPNGAVRWVNQSTMTNHTVTSN